MVLVLVAGCGNATPNDGAQNAIALTELPTTVPSPEPSATPTPAPQRPHIQLWLPEAVSPVGNVQAAEVLDEQIIRYRETQGWSLTITWRLKRDDGLGGILQALQTASAVAPAALPDLILMQRGDLLMAQQQGLLIPLDGQIDSAILNDVYPIGLALGQVDGVQYGVPYLLETKHLIYPPTLDTDQTGLWRYEDVLARNIPLTFAIASENGVNDVFWLQYASARTGNNELDVTALRNTLLFYERAVSNGIITANVLDNTNSSDYLVSSLSNDRFTVMTSTDYLDLTSVGETLSFAPIPTQDGTPRTIVNGWVWVVTARDAARQAQAFALLNWLMNAERQREYAVSINMLPSQRSGLQGDAPSPYALFTDTLLQNAILPRPEGDGGALSRALQNALIAVLLGERTADQATQDVLDALG
jgi:ABC-type glycerol-3-phosphate transport system substrate-binding protein